MEKLISLILLPLAAACSLFENGSETGSARISLEFTPESYFETKAVLALPDTNDFILNVRDAAGKSIYSGKYGDSPETMNVNPGSYTISVASADFSSPAFDSPQFGDEQCIVVRAGEYCRVKLLCSQTNSGVKLSIDREFLTAYPSAALLLKASSGSLMYSYSEKRTAYFEPGKIQLVMTENGIDNALYSKTLTAREMLLLRINAGTSSSDSADPAAARSGFSMAVDSVRQWISESYTIGSGGSSSSQGDGSESSEALTIARAKEQIGSEDVWVTGYIVGGDLTSSSMSFEVPFKSNTNLVIGPRSGSDDKESCMSVNLPVGALRTALNLVDHPELLKRKIALKGDIVAAYYGIPGIKNLSDYELR